MACLLAVSTIVVGLVLSGVNAADDRSVVMSTCKELADGDKHINYALCVSEVERNYNSSEGAGVSVGLAKAAAVAASIGMDNARHDLVVLIDKLGAGYNKTRLGQALDQCFYLYDIAGIDYTISFQLIYSKNYADAKKRFNRGTQFAIQCDDVLDKAKIDLQPLARHNKYAVQMGRICVAMGNRIIAK